MIRTMAIVDLLKLPSIDSDASTYPGKGGSWSIDNPLDDATITDDYHQGIMAEMEYDGYNRVPLHVDLGERMAEVYNTKIPRSLLSTLMMGNGHHRLKMMIMIGFTEARITDDPSESDDTGDTRYTCWAPDDDDYSEWSE